jgi:hypothetical protein
MSLALGLENDIIFLPRSKQEITYKLAAVVLGKGTTRT